MSVKLLQQSDLRRRYAEAAATDNARAKDFAARALREGSNQYAPSQGTPALRHAVAAHYGRHHDLDLSPDHVCVTSGATEALGAAILATVSPG